MPTLGFSLCPSAPAASAAAVFGGPSFDADAQAFFTAAGITNANQKTAVNSLVVGLKNDLTGDLWSLMTAIYPIVGGNASSHSVNLKSPGTHSVTWVNAPTHAQAGVAIVATSYGRVPPAIFSLSSPTNFSVGGVNTVIPSASTHGWFGARSNSGADQAYVQQYTSSNYIYAGIGAATATGNGLARTGMIHVYKTGTTVTLRQNLTGISSATNSGGLPNNEFLLGAYNQSGSPGTPTPADISTGANFTFFFVGQYLTPTQADALYNLIVSYNSNRGSF